MSRPFSEHLSIRSAGSQDAVEIARLAEELGYPMPPEEMARRLELVLANDDHRVLVAGFGDGPLTGWVHAEHRRSLEGGERAELMGLVVDSAARRRGVGRQLLKKVEIWAADRGLISIAVRSNVVRNSSHPFYEASGYACQKTQNVYVKSL